MWSHLSEENDQQVLIACMLNHLKVWLSDSSKNGFFRGDQRYSSLSNVLIALEKLHERHSFMTQVLSSKSTAPDQIINAWLSETLPWYNNLLFESIKLILDPHFSLSRQVMMNIQQYDPDSKHPRISFANAVFQIYHKLLIYRDTLGESNKANKQLNNLLQGFEHQFRSDYNIVNCNTFILNDVRDFFSYKMDLVAPTMDDFSQVAIKRDYFWLKIELSSIEKSLIEVFQLSDDKIALFRVNCGELPYGINPSKMILHEVKNGNERLLNLGRSLMFPPFRGGDLVISNFTKNGVQLKTRANGAKSLERVMQLESIDTSKWEIYWKLMFTRMFGNEPITNGSDHNHFVEKHHLLNNNKSQKVSGLGFVLEPSNKAEHQGQRENSFSANETSELKSKEFSLRRSEPLSKPLSSITSESLVDDLDKSSPPFDNMLHGKLSPCDAAMKYDFPIPIDSIQYDDKLSQRSHQTSDVESIISSYNPEDTNVKHSASSELDDFGTQNEVMIRAASKRPSSKSSENKNSDSFNIVDLTSMKSMLNTEEVKISLWDDTDWNLCRESPLFLCILKGENMIVFCIFGASGLINSVRFVAKISDSWRYTRASRQDTQLMIPRENILESDLPINSNILTLSCRQTDRFLTVLNYCIKLRC